MIERDRSRAQACAAEFGGQVLVMEGDATDQAVLHEERIEGVDDFIATTLGKAATVHYEIIIDDPPAVARRLRAGRGAAVR